MLELVSTDGQVKGKWTRRALSLITPRRQEARQQAAGLHICIIIASSPQGMLAAEEPAAVRSEAQRASSLGAVNTP